MARVSSSPRERLIEAGTRLLDSIGPEALQARKVAGEIGASTMAVYTHFGGMNGLLDAIVAASFERFGQALAATPTTDDPMADFFVMGYHYRKFALASPQRYRLMFGLTSQQLFRMPDTEMPVAATSFGQLVNALQRIVDTGRVRRDDVFDFALRIWSAIHGMVLLEIVRALSHGDRPPDQLLSPMMVDMFVGMGDSRENAEASLQRAAVSVSRPDRPR